MNSTTASDNNENNESTTSLPPLPPIPGLNLAPPPPLATSPVRASSNRNDLLAQIQNGNFKLKPVKISEKGMELDLSSMNKEERLDLAEHIRRKLAKRKDALNRRKASDS